MLTLELLSRKLYSKEKLVALEITPLTTEANTITEAKQLFNVIHGTLKPHSLIQPRFSFEIHSDKPTGIRFIIIGNAKYADLLMRHVANYAPTAKLQIIHPPEIRLDRVCAFKTKATFILPLKLQVSSLNYDRLTHVIGAMSNLESGEELGLQLIVKPIKLAKVRSLEHKILHNENIFTTRSSSSDMRPLAILSDILWYLSNLLSEGCQGLIMGDYKTKSSGLKDPSHPNPVTAKPLNPFELELTKAAHHKITQPLFKVNLRVFIKSDKASQRLRTVRSALSSYDMPPYQGLKLVIGNSLYLKRLTKSHLPDLKRNAMILSSDELAELYHLPETRGKQPDNLAVCLSHTLPAPPSLKREKTPGLVIGQNTHHNVNTIIRLTELERERHLYIVGGTGNGKTTMLLYSIMQDIEAGHGLAVIDPHGDLSHDILSHLPKERLEDVVYFNPDDLAYPIGLNLLELADGLAGDDLMRAKDLITESVISVMRKMFSSDDSGGHRVEYILRNATQTALVTEDPTIFTIFKLLNDSKYRRKVVMELKDENLKAFWKNEIGRAGDFQRVKMAAGITSKIGRFLFSASASRILGQPKSTIDFNDILDNSKILICNLSKGLLGEDTSAMFGTTILAKLQLAALQRARLPLTQRSDFYLYVDEFQNFATMSFVEMLSEARKYRLFLTMAEQSTAQQEQSRLTDVILANVGTVVSFRSGSPADEARLLPLFAPYIKAGEIANLPAYSFYVRIAAVDAKEPLSGTTLLLEGKGDDTIAQEAMKASRLKYGKKVTNTGLSSSL